MKNRSRTSQKASRRDREKGSILHRSFTVLGIILGAFCLPFLLVNLLLLFKSRAAPEKVPDLLGLSPMIVVTRSMEPSIGAGDMIVVRKTDPDRIREGDVISFFNPQNREKTGVITHRVLEILEEEDGSRSFRTKGDANNAPDPVAVSEDRLVGVYRMKIPVLGNLALFMKSTIGMLVFVVLPLVLLVTYDLILQRVEERRALRRGALIAETFPLITAGDRQATMPVET